MRRIAIALVLAALGLIAPAAPAAAGQLVDAGSALPAPPSAQLVDEAQEEGDLTLERATLYRVYLLNGDERLPDAYESDTPFDGTPVVRQIEAALPRMDPGPARKAVAAAASPQAASTCSTSATSLIDTEVTDHFVIQYNGAALDSSLTIDDYVESLETAWTTEVGTFGWAAPPVSPAAQSALGGKYHVRVDALASVLYGFVSNSGTYAARVGDNPNTPAWNDLDADATCMALNQSYAAFPGTPRAALDATTAHEFNHSLQYGYGALTGANAPELNFSEGGATWMEDEVQDASDDNYSYLYPEFESSMGQHAGNEYSYWLTFRGLTERFGTNAAGGAEDVMQTFWELTSRNAAGMLTAMQGALAPRGLSLARAFHDYAVAAKFVRPCGGVYALPLCFEEGGAYQAEAGGPPAATGAIPAIGAGFDISIEDNYALNWIGLPLGGAYDVTIANVSSGGTLRVSLACDTAAGVALAPVPVTLSPGASYTVPGFDPASCTQAVAVVTNESQTSANPGSSTPREYTITTTAAAAQTAPAVPPAGSGSSAGSVSDNPPPPPPAPAPAPVARRAAVSRLAVGRVRSLRDGTVRIRVRVSGAGTLKTAARARVRGSLLTARLRRFVVARRTNRPRRARMVTITLKAGKRARRVLRRKRGRSLKARATVAFRPRVGARRTSTEVVTFRLKR